MNKYLLGRKILQGAILIILMALIIFIVYRLMPGNPGEIAIRSFKGRITVQQKQAILASLGLAHGKWSLSDFLVYMKQMFTFNWGYDFQNPSQTVASIVFTALPYTLLLIGSTVLLSFVFGIPLGITATRLRGKRSEGALLTTSLVLTSIPYFILAILLFLYLAVYSSILPDNSNFTLNYLTNPTPAHLLYVAERIALPFISLIIVGATGHLLTMRASMVSVLGEDFITTARAKGVPEKSILRKHAARNALIPVTTRMALELALVISGAIIVGIIYNWPGLGLILYQAVLNEDYPLSEASAFIISLLTIFAYLITDYIHAWLDPRIKV